MLCSQIGETLSAAIESMAEQHHRFVIRQGNSGFGFGAFHTMRQIIQGYEVTYMPRKGQLQGVSKRDVRA